MVYILLGEDDFSIRQSLEEIKRGIGDPIALVTNTTTLNGQEATLERLRNACETVPFLAEKRLLIIEGLLERFESRNKSNRKKTPRLTTQPNEYQKIATYFNRIPQFTILVLLDGKISQKNPLLRELSDKAEVRFFPLIKEAKLRQWIEQRIKEAGGSISPQAAELLAKFVGGNLWIMASEIDKLVLFANARRIEEEDIKTVVSYAQEANVFTLIDAILELKSGVAQKALQQLLQQGAAPAFILSMLSRQVRILVQVKELKNQKKTNIEIQSKLGMASDFVFHKALEQAGKYSLARLKEVYHQLLEADLAIKTGKYDGELALDLLVADLFQGSKV